MDRVVEVLSDVIGALEERINSAADTKSSKPT
jgi:hypothetical protein